MKITISIKAVGFFLHFSSSILDVSQWHEIQLINVMQWGKSKLVCQAGLQAWLPPFLLLEGFKGHYWVFSKLLMSIICNVGLRNKLSLTVVYILFSGSSYSMLLSRHIPCVSNRIYYFSLKAFWFVIIFISIDVVIVTQGETFPTWPTRPPKVLTTAILAFTVQIWLFIIVSFS